MRKKTAQLLCTWFLCLCTVLGAQAQKKNEVGLVIGATTVPSVSVSGGPDLSFSSALALGAEYDRRLNSGNTALYFGVDFLASPLDVKMQHRVLGISPEYAYIFLTPHLRVKFNTQGSLQPWLLVGGGYTRFSASKTGLPPGFQGGSNTGALEFGGGLDTAPFIHLLGIPIGARLEIRDFYSGTPNYGIAGVSDRQNTIAYTGGLLLRF
jgi:hypothetical protein